MSLILENVVKRAGPDTHIYETSVEFKADGFNILLGTTLSGKTSLIQMMAGLERPTSGKIWFGGKDVTKVAVQKRNVSMVHQQFINYPNYSVFDNIASPLKIAKMSKSAINERVGKIADLLKLTAMLGRNPSELSGGQQQRTALARALVKDADLVLLDEPLANLDYKLREELRDELPKMLADRGCMVIYATSEPAESLMLSGYTAALDKGRVTEYGPSAEIYRNPVNLKTAQVCSDPPINTVTVEKLNDRIKINSEIFWTATNDQIKLPNGKYTVAVRAHHVKPSGNEQLLVKISGKILVTELSGSESVAHFNFDGATWISQSHGVHNFDVGSVKDFYIDTYGCLFFDEQGRRVVV